MATPELSLLQARNEISSFYEHLRKMYATTTSLLKEDNKKKYLKKLDRIAALEESSDRIELEIADYLTEVSSGHISASGSRDIQNYLNIIDNMESISDCIFNLAKTFKRKSKEKVEFNQEIRKNIGDMFKLVEAALENMGSMLSSNVKNQKLDKADEFEQKINKYRNKLRKERLAHIEQQRDYSYFAGVLYSDLFSESEKLADYVYNVCESASELTY